MTIALVVGLLLVPTLAGAISPDIATATDDTPKLRSYGTPDLFPPITDEEWAATTHDPDPTWLPTENNLLVIDAMNGETISWDDKGSTFTDIRLRGVEPGAEGFMLLNPQNVRVFFDKTATPNGDVTFWSMDLQDGQWTVLQAQEGTDPKLVTAFTPSLDADGILDFLFGASYSTRPQAHGYRAPANCGPYTRETELRELYTPLAVLHSPYGGSSTMTAGYTSTKTVYVGSWGWSGERTATFTLASNSGNSQVALGIAGWGLYENGNSCQEWGGTKTYYTKVDYWQAYLAAQSVKGSDSRTDRDDATVWSPGVYFDHRYNGYSGTTVTGPSSTITEHSSNKAVTTQGGAVSFSKGYLNVNIGATSQQTQTYYYDYNFPSGGTWRWGNVRNSEQVRAFCYPTSGVTC